MDIITQAALGGAVAQAGYKTTGRRGILFGAFCGIVPDLDGLLSIGDGWQDLVIHRGSSHSLLVLPLLALPIGWWGWRFLNRSGDMKAWIWLAFWSLITHPLLDSFTTYGTQLFAPLSDHRFAFDTVAIVDLFYSLPIFAAVALGLRGSVCRDRAAHWSRRALTWGCLYLAAQLGWTKANVWRFEARLADAGFEAVHVRSPAPILWPPLRHMVARDSNGRIAISKQVLWAPERGRIIFVDSLDNERVRAALSSDRGQIWRWFSDGMIGVQRLTDGTLVFSDHRYGLYLDPTYSFFRAELQPDAAPSELSLVHPRRSRSGINFKQELKAGFELVMGFGDAGEPAHSR